MSIRVGVERFLQAILDRIEKCSGLARMDESASRDLGSGHDPAGLTIDRNDHHQDAILGKRLAIADDNVSDSADAQAINIDEAGIDMARYTEHVSARSRPCRRPPRT